MKTKCKLTAIVIALVVFTSSLFVGCGFKKENVKDQKYDVAIKIQCSDGKEWIFPPSAKELTYEYDYAGVKKTFRVDRVCLVNHPRHRDVWFTSSLTGTNVLQSSLMKVGQMCYKESPKYVCEKGTYCFIAYAESTSTLWHPRYVKLKMMKTSWKQ